jgi:hypothetical protein
MPSLDKLLSDLEESKRDFGGAAARVERLLEQLGKRRFPDPESLIRFHEALLFIRSHPQSERGLRLADELLSSFAQRVGSLRSSGADLTPFDYIEYSGIAGTALSGTFSYDITKWLVEHYPSAVEVDWERYEKKERLSLVLPRLLPLFYEESLVEANIPHLDWLRAAKSPDQGDLHWIIKRFEQLDTLKRERGHLYDSLELPVRWDLDDLRASRTQNRRGAGEAFYHTGPLIRRNEVALEREILSPVEFEKLSRKEGESAIDMLRATTTVRYRELYGITHGDARQVSRADVGRGVEIFLWGLAPDRRLPLRAYHAGFTLKNGVPINYIEGITLFERTELGFNTFYTYREGESAWVYSQVLRVLHQKVGVTCFSIDPYQIGLNNDEAIESGAFWFYRKLGFRSTLPELRRATEREEKKIRAGRDYRTSTRTLRQLSKGHIIYELPGRARGDWDRFSVRNLGLAVQRQNAKEPGGGLERAKQASEEMVARRLRIKGDEFDVAERTAFAGLAPVLALISDLDRWSELEKSAVVEIIRAKAAADETRYARLLQKHERLRAALIKIGSTGQVTGDREG